MSLRRNLLSIAIIVCAIIYAFYRTRYRTYCYESVKTNSKSSGIANCFTVSKTGTFSRVFALDPSKADRYKQPGHALPGLWDGHGHLLQYGEMLQGVNLFGADSLEEAQRRIYDYVVAHPEEGSREEWIRGMGWDQAAFGRMPTAADLAMDEKIASKYIMLDRVDVHCTWVSQPVLDLLPDPLPPISGGEIVTDPGMGVFCDNAMSFVRQYWPQPGYKKRSNFVRTAAKHLNELGLVGMHDAGLTPRDIHLLEDMNKRPEWSLRIYGMFECEERNTFCPEQAIKISQPDGFLTVRSVKLFADGALGSWGSALIDPYDDRPDTSGSLLVNATELTRLAREWALLGYQINIHAIGDMANRLTIDALLEALSAVCPNDHQDICQASRRFRIEHSQIMHPVDQKRVHEAGLIPSIQPTHATSDMSYAEDRLGKQRIETEAYRMKSFLPLNPVLGSDFPVEPPNPWHGIYAATTRKSPQTGLGKGGSQEGWHTEEALTLEQALFGFTLGPAHGAFLEGKAGVIQEGAFADWVVLDRPFHDLKPEDLLDVRVRETWIAGKKVYSRED